MNRINLIEEDVVVMVENILEVEVLINWLWLLFDKVEKLLLKEGIVVLNEFIYVVNIISK